MELLICLVYQLLGRLKEPGVVQAVGNVVIIPVDILHSVGQKFQEQLFPQKMLQVQSALYGLLLFGQCFVLAMNFFYLVGAYCHLRLNGRQLVVVGQIQSGVEVRVSVGVPHALLYEDVQAGLEGRLKGNQPVQAVFG